MTAKPLALITGASSGIGFHLARQFAEHGHDIVVVSNDGPELREAHQKLTAEFRQVSVEAVEADLSRREGVEKLHGSLSAKGRPLDVLAANAGAGVAGPFSETDLEAELSVIGLNVTNQVHLIKLVLRDMLARGEGKILITASLIALSPGPFMAIYAATKAFLHSFGLAIRNELQETPIAVTVLMPGATESEFWERADMEDTNVGRSKKDDPADVAKEAFEALEKESAYVVSGFTNKVRAGLTAVTPDTVLAQANRSQAQPAEDDAKS